MEFIKYRISVFKVVLAEKLTSYASRGKQGLFNRFCCYILEGLLTLDPADEYMSDEICDANIGYDPSELDRYQKGEIEDTNSAGV
ncbi:MAG: hypothetical protein ACJAQS_000085 [Porticoccus sp.]|jgi:hypothetical protein